MSVIRDMKEDMEEKLKAYKAIANETRLAILLEISAENEGLPFGKLREELKLNSNALDYHLEKLTNAGLIMNVPRTPVTKRAQHSEVLGLMTLSKFRETRLPTEDKQYYSYYRITALGKEMLEKLGFKKKAAEK